MEKPILLHINMNEHGNVQSKFYSPATTWLHACRAAAEYCFVTGDRQRIRLVQKLRRSDHGWDLHEVEVSRERWEADYNGGKELAGKVNGRQADCTLDLFICPDAFSPSPSPQAGALFQLHTALTACWLYVRLQMVVRKIPLEYQSLVQNSEEGRW